MQSALNCDIETYRMHIKMCCRFYFMRYNYCVRAWGCSKAAYVAFDVKSLQYLSIAASNLSCQLLTAKTNLLIKYS